MDFLFLSMWVGGEFSRCQSSATLLGSRAPLHGLLALCCGYPVAAPSTFSWDVPAARYPTWGPEIHLPSAKAVWRQACTPGLRSPPDRPRGRSATGPAAGRANLAGWARGCGSGILWQPLCQGRAARWGASGCRLVGKRPAVLRRGRATLHPHLQAARVPMKPCSPEHF